MHSFKEYKLEEIDPFSNLGPNEIQTLYKSVGIKTYEKGDTLFTPMDRCNHLGVIIMGSINMIKLLSSGKELRIDKLKAGSLFGELICLSNKKYPAWIKADEKTKVILIKDNTLLSLLKNENVLKSFMNKITSKSINLTHKVEILSLKKVEQKVAYYILNFGDIDCSISKLSDFLGVTRESASRAVNKLKKQGVLNSIYDLENLLLD